MYLHVELLDGRLPSRSHEDDVGLDCFAAAEVVIDPLTVGRVRLGFRAEFPSGWEVTLWSRSGLASRGVFCVGGLIDPGYRGEWCCLLYNSTGLPFSVSVGDKVCQAVCRQVWNGSVVEVTSLSGSARGEAGFGSTDR